MTEDPHAGLSAREREILHILYRLGTAPADTVREEMVDPPTNATVRSTLRVLEEKGWVTHRRDGMRFVFEPTHPGETVRERALGHLVKTFFAGSKAEALAALLGSEGNVLSPNERERITLQLERMEEADTE